MANICLQFGIDGRQLGGQLFDKLLIDSPCDGDVNFWFDQEQNGKLLGNRLAINTDPESSTLTIYDSTEQKCSLKRDYHVSSPLGVSSNTWSFGNNIIAPELYGDVNNELRKLSEKLDTVHGFLCIGAIGDGNECGVGTCICRHLKNDFPSKTMTVVGNLPSAHCESSVKNYNTLFSIAKIYDISDAIILYSNEGLRKQYGTKSEAHNSDPESISDIFAEQLSCILQCDDKQNILNQLPVLALHNDFKLLNLQSAPCFYKKSIPTVSWESVIENIEHQIFYKNTPSDEVVESSMCSYTFEDIKTGVNECSSLLVSVRDNTRSELIPILERRFNNDFLYTAWSLSSYRLHLYQRNGSFLGRNKFCTAVVNNGHFTSVLEELVSKSWKTFNTRAFTHQYLANGCDEADFIEMFITMEHLTESYKSLRKNA